MVVASRTANCFRDTAKNTRKGQLTAESRDTPRTKIYTKGGRVLDFGPEIDERLSGFHDCEALIAAERTREAATDSSNFFMSRPVNPGTTGNTSSTERGRS